MAQIDEFRTNGSAAVDIHAVQENTARPLREPEHLPDAPERSLPVRRVRTRLKVAPFTILGTMAVIVLLFLVLFSYIRLYEVQSSVSQLKSEKSELAIDQQRLRSQYENSLDLQEIEARAKALGMRKALASQIVYVEVAADDTAEVYAAPAERNIFERVYDAFRGVLSDVVEYFS